MAEELTFGNEDTAECPGVVPAKVVGAEIGVAAAQGTNRVQPEKMPGGFTFWVSARPTTVQKKYPMKQLLLLLTLAFTGFGTATLSAQNTRANLGQERPERGDRQARMAERLNQQVNEMKDGLKLTDEQVVAVTDILKKTNGRMQELRRSGTDRKEMRAKMKPLLEEQDAAIEALLTKKQAKRYKNWKAQRDEERRERGGRPAGPREGGR